MRRGLSMRSREIVVASMPMPPPRLFLESGPYIELCCVSMADLLGAVRTGGNE